MPIIYTDVKDVVDRLIQSGISSIGGSTEVVPPPGASTPPQTPQPPQGASPGNPPGTPPPPPSGPLPSAKTYTKQDMKTQPFPITVYGNFNAKGLPRAADAFHSFDHRRDDSFGGRMFQHPDPLPQFASRVFRTNAINDILQWLNSYGRKAEVNKIIFNLDFDNFKVEWKAVIDASSDGRAYKYASYRGGIGSINYPTSDPLKHPGTSGNILLSAIQKGNWKYIPVEVYPKAPYTNATPSVFGCITVLGPTKKLVLRQFLIQSDVGIY